MQTVFCDECVEEIPDDEVYWEGERLYCHRCGREIDQEEQDPDSFEAITRGKAGRLYSSDEDDDAEDFAYDKGSE